VPEPSRRGFLTPQDGLILTHAIQQALRQPSSPRTPKPKLWRAVVRGLVQLLAGLAFAGLAWAFLTWLLTSHVTLRVAAISSAPESLTHLSVDGPTTRWTAEGVMTDRITVLDPTANIEIALPIPIRRCLSLFETCSDGAVSEINLPAEFSFSREVATQAEASRSIGFDMDRLPPAGNAQQPGFALISTGGRVTLSFTVSEATTLVISSAGVSLPPIELRPRDGGLPDDRRIHVELVVGGAHAAPESALLMNDVTAIDGLKTRGASAELDGFAGKIVLFGSTTKLISPPTTVSLVGDGTQEVESSFAIGSAAAGVQLTSVRASSVKTDEGELLPSRWADRPQFWGPILTAIMGALVLELTIGSLGDLIKGGLDKISGRAAKK
jgi:hypothetical protein